MHRTLATVFTTAILLAALPLGGQENPDADRPEEMRIEVPLEILSRAMPRFQLGDLDGVGPPALALAAQAERLISIPEGESGVHGWWSSIALDAADRAAARPRSQTGRQPIDDLSTATPGRPPWISGAHFDATAFSDALLVEGLAGTASVDAGGVPGKPVRVPQGLFGGYFSAATRQPSGEVDVGFSRSVWLRNVLAPGTTVDEVALLHGQFADRGGTASRYYGVFLDNGTGSAAIAEGYGLYLTPVPGEIRYGVYQAGNERNVFNGPVEIRSDLRVTGEIVTGAAAGAGCDQAAVYLEVTAPARLSALGPRTVVALGAGAGDGVLELDDATPGSSLEIVRVDECPASASRVRWAGGSADVGCGQSLRLLFAAGAWRPVR